MAETPRPPRQERLLISIAIWWLSETVSMKARSKDAPRRGGGGVTGALAPVQAARNKAPLSKPTCAMDDVLRIFSCSPFSLPASTLPGPNGSYNHS